MQTFSKDMLASYKNEGIKIVKSELETFSPLSIKVRHILYAIAYNSISILLISFFLEFNERSKTTVEES